MSNIWDDRSQTELKVEAMLAELKVCQVLVQVLIDGHDPDITLDTRRCLELFDEIMKRLEHINELGEK